MLYASAFYTPMSGGVNAQLTLNLDAADVDVALTNLFFSQLPWSREQIAEKLQRKLDLPRKKVDTLRVVISYFLRPIDRFWSCCETIAEDGREMGYKFCKETAKDTLATLKKRGYLYELRGDELHSGPGAWEYDRRKRRNKKDLTPTYNAEKLRQLLFEALDEHDWEYLRAWYTKEREAAYARAVAQAQELDPFADPEEYTRAVADLRKTASGLRPSSSSDSDGNASASSASALPLEKSIDKSTDKQAEATDCIVNIRRDNEETGAEGRSEARSGGFPAVKSTPSKKNRGKTYIAGSLGIGAAALVRSLGVVAKSAIEIARDLGEAFAEKLACYCKWLGKGAGYAIVTYRNFKAGNGTWPDAFEEHWSREKAANARVVKSIGHENRAAKAPERPVQAKPAIDAVDLPPDVLAQALSDMLREWRKLPKLFAQLERDGVKHPLVQKRARALVGRLASG